MVLVISTFKVKNGMEAAVRQAFLERPGLVDHAPGFLCMEVLVDHQDASVFHLLTRWADEPSFQKWHAGPLHKLAHQGIPKGLKLDPAYTAVSTFVALPADGGEQSARKEEAPATGWPGFLAGTRSLHWLKVSLGGEILSANPAFELLLQESASSLAGQSLWARLTQPDAAKLQAMLKSGSRDSDGPTLLNFVNPDQSVQTLECYLDVGSSSFVLLGEPLLDHDRALAKELLELNNRWALLVRENEKNAKALRQANEDLKKALADLNESHWHLRKIQETLPICMYCGKVKTGSARWEGVVEYLKANSLFLSHGCCPNCIGVMNGEEDGSSEC